VAVEWAPDPAVGLCMSCLNATRVVSARGSVFWRCGLSASDPRFAKYPPLPVVRCAGYRPRDGRYVSAKWPLLLTLGVSAALWLLPSGAVAQSRELLATIVTLGGRAEILRKTGSAWADATLREELFEGDGVRTLAGRLTLHLASAEALRLGPRTQVFFLAGDGRTGGGSTHVRMDSGRLWLSVPSSGPAAARVELRAGPVSVSGRGGGASITMNADGSVLVGVAHGSVISVGEGWARALTQDQELLVPAAGMPKGATRLTRDKRDAEWMKGNEQQDLAGGYGARRAEP